MSHYASPPLVKTSFSLGLPHCTPVSNSHCFSILLLQLSLINGEMLHYRSSLYKSEDAGCQTLYFMVQVYFIQKTPKQYICLTSFIKCIDFIKAQHYICLPRTKVTKAMLNGINCNRFGLQAVIVYIIRPTHSWEKKMTFQTLKLIFNYPFLLPGMKVRPEGKRAIPCSIFKYRCK